MIVPKAGTQNPKPTDNWSVTAFYNGNGSFDFNRATKSGTARV